MVCFLLVMASTLRVDAHRAGQGDVTEGRRRGSALRRPSPEAERGQSQFLKTCSFCHGAEANGGAAGPNLMRSPIVRHDEKGNLIGQVVREGRPEKGMPPIQLTSDQLSDVAAFLHYRVAVSDGRSAPRPGADYSAAKLLVGNANAGKAFFNGAGGCSACHSPTGDLAGIAHKYPAVDLQTRFLFPAEPYLTATVTDSSGKQYRGRIRLHTNYEFAIEDSDGWYHSWPLDKVKVEVKDPLVAHRKLLSQFTDSEMHDMLAYLETLK
ncbi:MAG TPA: cytochrome c [Terriglobia bacterium]|nr:cytochrome c [Terriglobia bacterium]